MVILTGIYLIPFLIQDFTARCGNFLGINYKIVNTIIKYYQMFYIFILGIIFLCILSTLILANNMNRELKNIEVESNKFEEISNNIFNNIKESKDWGVIKWFSCFDNPELIIKSNNKRCEIKKFNNMLNEKNIKKEFDSLIRLSLIIILFQSLPLLTIGVLGGMIFIWGYIINLRYMYFDPTIKNSYEFIKEENNSKHFIITEYKDKLLIMPGEESKDKEGKLELVLDNNSYKLISISNDDRIFIEDYDDVKFILENNKENEKKNTEENNSADINKEESDEEAKNEENNKQESDK